MLTKQNDNNSNSSNSSSKIPSPQGPHRHIDTDTHRHTHTIITSSLPFVCLKIRARDLGQLGPGPTVWAPKHLSRKDRVARTGVIATSNSGPLRGQMAPTDAQTYRCTGLGLGLVVVVVFVVGNCIKGAQVVLLAGTSWGPPRAAGVAASDLRNRVPAWWLDCRPPVDPWPLWTPPRPAQASPGPFHQLQLHAQTEDPQGAGCGRPCRPLASTPRPAPQSDLRKP